jgi:LacI family transcriptional regulator
VPNKVPHVALIIETSTAYGRGVLGGIAKYVAAHGPWSIYVDQRGLNDPPPRWLADWKGDGVIMRAQTQSIAKLIAKLGVPAVDTQQQLSKLSAPSVICDHRAVAEAAVKHLLERHFTQFAFVGVERALWSKLRCDRFVECVRRTGHKCHVYAPLSRRRFAESWEGGQIDLQEWLESLPKPVGVMAAHDLRALCVLDACRRGGLAVPEQVAVIGVDNDETLCRLADPQLSSVKLNLEVIGYESAALLGHLMRGRKPPKNPIVIKPLDVVARRSTDVIAIDDTITAQAMRLIHQHACSGLTVADVAEHCRVSRRLMERSFRLSLKTSPHEEIVRAKVARAKQLLSETDYALETIAAKCGISHAPYLSVLFKRETGSTPGEFRQQASEDGRRFSADVRPTNGRKRVATGPAKH